jgi:hypothetical protein
MFRNALVLAAAAALFLVPSLGANRPESPVKQTKADRPAPDQEVGDLTGYYTCKGLETSGKTYTGIVVLTKKNDVYLIQWNCGGSSFLGVGIRQGNTLAASWTIPGDAKGMVRGVNMYRIETGPRLVGRWATLPGNGMLQSETLTFLKTMDEDETE